MRKILLQSSVNDKRLIKKQEETRKQDVENVRHIDLGSLHLHAAPAPAPCRSVPEEICEIKTEFTGGGQPIFSQACRIEIRVVGDCGN